MKIILTILSTCTSIYMLIVFVRILLTWFSGSGYSRPIAVLSRVTDPYLNWFRRFPLRIGHLDLSPIVALAALSLVNRIFSTMAAYGRISLGIILAMSLQAIWSAASFLLGFSIIILILRLIADLANSNIHSPFWSIIDAISQPLLYRINRIFFGNRIAHYRKGLLIAIGALIVVSIAANFIIRLFSVFLARLPI
ncbi:YggT family protein [Leadbettera azotonutricia]|uniref:Yggt family protein n=1 Tax=Leadbettera azotonutricia (strain ATCC BAA-888 / DSM 13862 / ZAS-9) TaxID=545695 RepID=F5YAH0_LEAAZ|nr:YggT family protein [Leadbettera azotonutricia]AEF81702.1 yggt family protein [Leadbettera azotonutricia ZAS-9]